MEFIATMAIVLEVFALIAIGYGAAAFNLLKPEIGDGLGDFVFLVAVPVLVFRTLSGASFDGPSPWLLWFSFFTAAFVTWFAGGLLTRRVFGRDARASVIGGISSVFGNTVLVGIPVVYSVFGPDGAVPLLLIISIHMPLMMTLSSILIERAEIADGIKQTGTSLVSVFSKVARTLIRNPVIIALFAALLFRQTGLTLSGVPGAIADQLAAAAVPCALFSLGMSLKKYGIRGNLPPAPLPVGSEIVRLSSACLVFWRRQSPDCRRSGRLWSLSPPPARPASMPTCSPTISARDTPSPPIPSPSPLPRRCCPWASGSGCYSPPDNG